MYSGPFVLKLAEVITLVLDSCDPSLTPFHQVCLPQFSTNTLLLLARSGHFQWLQAMYALPSECCNFLMSNTTWWTWSQDKCTLWTHGGLGDHAYGVLCKLFVLCPAFPCCFLR